MEFDIKVEIKIHGHHPCSEQKEGPRSLTAKPNRFPSALPERFQKTQQIQPELLHCKSGQVCQEPFSSTGRLCSHTVPTVCLWGGQPGPAMGAPGQQSQHYSWNTAHKGQDWCHITGKMKLTAQALPGSHGLGGWVRAQHARKHCWEGRVVQGSWRASEVRAALDWQMNMTKSGRWPGSWDRHG